MIEVLRAPPYLLVEDQGRPGFRGQGVPLAGAMDPESLALGNLLVGNDPGAAGCEWALGAGRLRFLAGGLWFAITGARADLALNDHPLAPWTRYRAQAGDELALGVPRDGRFCYLALAGGIAVPPVMGSRSTYLTGRFGGFLGRPLRQGDRLPLGPAGAIGPGGEGGEGLELPEALRPIATGPIRVVEGPQAELFDAEAWDLLRDGAFTVSPTSDRMGYRLAGPTLSHRASAAIPSEPACPGALQVPAGSPPIVLMPDGPTVGGYPKLAVVLSGDLARVAQHGPGDGLAFERVSLGEAHRELARAAERRRDATTWATRGGGR